MKPKRKYLDRSRGEIRKLRNDCLRSQEEVAAILKLTRTELQSSESRALAKFRNALFHLLGRLPDDANEAAMALLENNLSRIPRNRKRDKNVGH
jgi:hypothetical protein